MADKYQTIATGIYAHIGGPQNVAKLIHCMTRVRITVRDDSKVDVDGLKKVPGVLGVAQEDTLQVIVGPGVVNKVAQAMVDQVGVGLGEPFPDANSSESYAAGKSAVEAKAAEVHAAQKAQLKQTWWRQALKHISAIFIPLIPAFVGAGLISGIAGILANMQTAGDLGTNWTTFITVLKVINSGLFTYLNIYVGINAAKEFKATPGLGGIIAGLIYLPGVVAPVTLPNIFTGSALVAGSGGIIGVLFAVWVMSYVEKFFHKVIPDSVDIIFSPFLTLLIVGCFTIFLVMPAAGWVSSSLVGSINWILHVGGAFAGFMLGLFFLPMVMLGLHQILTPIHLEMIKSLGNTPLLPILAMAGAGQVGAAIALWIRCRKNKQLTGMIKGALPVGVLGVGEPLIYGVSLPLGRPFITACVGGGIGGAVIGAIGGIGATSIGPSGVALIPLIANGKWLGYVFGLLAAYAGGFLATFFFGVPKSAMLAHDVEGNLINASGATVASATDASSIDVDQIMNATPVAGADTNLVATASGQLIQMSAVKDATFAQKMLGDGFAIVPNMEAIVAPADGTIISLTETKHAFTLKTDSGLELLVHMGIDTVELGGKPFNFNIKPGDHVSHGQQLGTMDLKQVQAAGKDTTVITVITNMDAVATLSQYNDGAVEVGSPVMQAHNK
ncbi:PTS system sucrose-specific transporter subunit IIABC [Lacticaseibacillus thailandensis DSM 22698 = JCM 13996]|uniref:PTS system sucrose-specific EIIBCA component n=2 Tax=Lacticaseibacillus thailandensis TaxID=381741 RepID=A0A0R2C577_9LACO|nr:PTS system sucrose-specific transporter subunit IIABC [Lacticaseibacillus thailandensis DSM 22698 = JCM 13996]